MSDVKLELYIPRKCSATNRIIGAKDHASVQINIGHLNEHGVFDGTYTTVALSGYIRKEGLADKAINRIAVQKGLMKDINKFARAISVAKTH